MPRTPAICPPSATTSTGRNCTGTGPTNDAPPPPEDPPDAPPDAPPSDDAPPPVAEPLAEPLPSADDSTGRG
ncbi:MAG: hypothetical protein BRD44_03055 [Bacteroidetes bacterium QS_7_67_15]|nr:MAG: hypothetical protein BRD44_03055 [Bacteroidetes bacterium QS_7_67_15]